MSVSGSLYLLAAVSAASRADRTDTRQRLATTHPAFDRSVHLPAEQGATVLPTSNLRPAPGNEAFTWAPVIDALPAAGNRR